MAAILTVQDLAKSFGTRRVLGGVSFAVGPADRLGLVGVNGSGKSTLLRLVVGAADGAPGTDDGPDGGLITRRRGLTLAYVPQEPVLDLARTVVETLREGHAAHAAALARLEALGAALGSGALAGSALDGALAEQAALHHRVDELGGWDLDHEIRGLAAALGLPPFAAVVGTLSGGERRRVALARALLGRPELLALDEPTNHLDARTIGWLEERLRTYPGALLLVTHDRYFLDRVATRILELDRGQLHAYEGGYTRFLEKQAERLAGEAARERARAMFVRRELDWIRRGPQARATKQQARIDRFDTAVAAGEAQRAGGARPGDRTLQLELPTGGRLGKTILELRGLGKSLGGKQLFRDLSLIFKPGDRIGVIGPNGAGKTTLVRLVLGLLTPDAGEVVRGQSTRFAFLDQGRADLKPERTVLEEVADGNDFVVLESGAIHVRTFLRMLLFDDQFADTPVGTLSGGERNRVQLARILRAGANFLILDEPTNDLDLFTLGALEDALARFPGCALVVSHDRWFLDRVATGILAFDADGVVRFHEGNYSDYLARQPAAPAPAAPPAATPRPAPAPKTEPPAPGARRLTWREQQELRGIEAAVEAAEARVAALTATLNDPALARERGREIPALVAALDAARAEVERLWARWQELEAASQ
ncbi:MAG TPA: ABC-F family ATP-binding cassette domain-containing protein [Polyangia bacterium]